MPLFPVQYKVSPTVRKVLIGVGVAVLIVMSLHIWFINNARSILINIVAEKSNGQVRLELEKARFNFFSNRLQITRGELTTTDTLTAKTSYRVKFNSLTLKVRSFWPLLLKKNLYLDSININSPVIEVAQWRKDTVQAAKPNDLSITQEMGIMYNSLLDVLRDFGVRRILVNNASIKLINKTVPGSFPLWITNINLNVLRNPGDTEQKGEQSVRLQTNNQSIGFPSGRHRLAFRHFDLQLLKNRIELDSCTISAVARGKSTSSYSIFFKKLMLVGVDFAAMSNLNLVRADSVYCINPMFNITLNPRQDATKKKQRTDPEKIIKEMTSDLDLAFIGVKDAGIQLNILGERPRKIINGNKDNFEIRGLQINGDSLKPISVQRFDMVVRDYHLYNVDSSAIFGFDSIHFSNRKIVLNNFSVVTTPSRFKVKSLRDFRFPRFELTDLDWYALLFDQDVVARQAVLTNPVINYTRRTAPSNKKENLFERLQNLDSLMTLDQLSIENGKLNLNFGKATEVHMDNVNLKVLSNRLMRATNRESLRKAVDYFSLSNGMLVQKDLTVQLLRIKYDPRNIIYADKLLMTSNSGKVTAEVNDVVIDNMLIDEQTEGIEADAVQWRDARLQLLTAKKAEDKKTRGKTGKLNIKNIRGQKTTLVIDNGVNAINGAVTGLSVQLLQKEENGPLHIEGLNFGENNINLSNQFRTIEAKTNGLQVDKMILANAASDIIADGIRWAGADVRVDILQPSQKVEAGTGSISINNLAAEHSRIELTSPNGHLKTTIDLLQAEELSKSGNSPFTSNGFLVDGHDFSFSTPQLSTSATSFRVAQHDSSFVQNARFLNTANNDTTSAIARALHFTIDVNTLLAGRYAFDNLDVDNPELMVSANGHDTAKNEKVSSALQLTINSLQLQKPSVKISSNKAGKSTQLLLPASDGGVMLATNFKADATGLSIDSVSLYNHGFGFTGNDGTSFNVGTSPIRAELSSLKFQPQSNKAWQATVDEITVQQPDLKLKGKALPVNIAALSVGGLHLSNTTLYKTLLETSKNAWLRTTSALFTNTNSTIRWGSALYSNIDKTLAIDSFRFTPMLSKTAFMAQLPYEADYLTFEAGTILLKGVDLERFSRDSVIAIATVNVYQPVVDIYRDKQLKDAPPERKFFPGEMISKVDKALSVGVVNVSGGAVNYTEKNAKTGIEGTLQLSAIEGSIKNINNRNLSKQDSLQVDLHALLMNAAPLHLQVSESYADTANGFDMRLRLAPFAIPALNPVMTPLAGIRIQQGRVDTLQVHAIANENFAVGKIDMHYRDLKIRLAGNGKNGRGNLKERLMGFLANTFVIKNNNDKSGIIFHARKKDKSFFNYLLKIAMDGVGSSVGAGNNYKKIRQINKAETSGLLPNYAPVFSPAKPSAQVQ